MSISSEAIRPTSSISRPTSFEISWRRRFTNRLTWGACWLLLLLVIGAVVWILEGIIDRALPNWRWSSITEVTTGLGGGLANAVVGTLVIAFGVAILAGVVGIGCGIYLAEFCSYRGLAGVLRSAFEVLAGIPSIVFGYVGYVALVVGLHWQFSLLAALIVVGMLVVPYIAKATELSFSQVPVAYREGGEALGMTKIHVLRRLVFRSAVPGILTGIILAMAISVGETAPLIYTAGWSNAFPTGALIRSPVGYLTYAAYSFYDDPTKAFQALAADASLMLLVLVIVLILGSRLIVRVTQKNSPNRAF